MGMFIEAMKGIGELDMLFYVSPDLPVTPSFTREMEDRLSKHWDTQLRLDLCKLATTEKTKGRWEEYIRPALKIVNQPPYMQAAQSEQIDAFHRMLSRSPDMLFIHRLSCMPPVVLSEKKLPPVYFDLDDIEHVAFTRSVKQPPRWHGKPLLYLRLPILRAFERRAIRLSHTTFVCSEHDKQYLSKTYNCQNLAVVPNAIDIPGKQGLPDKPSLLFLGPLSYPPNAVAADHLIKNIWPMVLSAIPEARLRIAGAYPERTESFKENPPGVEFPGFVNDLCKLYEETSVVCCPILSGGGTRIKILEAAAFGKPVVSTTIGAEGIDLRDGEGILLRDDPGSFADACIRLLRDNTIAAKIGEAARLHVAQLYDKKHVVEKIKMHLNNSDNAAHKQSDTITT